MADLTPEQQDLLSRAGGGTQPATAAAPATPAAAPTPGPIENGGPPEGAISYGWRIGKHTLGVGAQTVIDGLNDFWHAHPSDLYGAQDRLRGAAKIIGGALQMFPGAPISFLTSGAGQTLEKAAPGLAKSMVVDPGNAEGIHRVLDPFNAIAMALETPESMARMTPEQQQSFAQRAAGYGEGITFREAFETALGVALPIAVAHQMKGTGATAAEKPAAEVPKPPAAAPKAGEAAPATPVPTEAPPPAAEPVAAPKPPWQMTREELATAEKSSLADERAAAVEVFGEKAKEYERLQRAANSTVDLAKADAASEQIAKMESALTPEQQQRLFGQAGVGPESAETYRDFARAIDRIGGDTPEELGGSLRWAITRLGDVTDPAQMTPSQQIAYAQLRRGFEIAQEQGFDQKAVSAAALKAAAQRFRDPEDALYMLQGFLKKRPTAPEPPAPALPAGETAPPSGVIPTTEEHAMAFAERVNAEPPPEVPPPGTTGPRVFGINWERLGQDESTKRVILDVNKTLSEQGRTVAGEGARPVEAGGPGAKTLAGMTEAAREMGVTVEDVLGLPEVPKKVASLEDIPAFTAGANAVHEVAARSVRDLAQLAVGGDQAARTDLPSAIALFNEMTLKTKDLGTNLAQSLNARKAGNVAPVEGVAGTSMKQFQETVSRLAGMKDIDKAAEMITAMSKTPSVVRRFLGHLGDAAARGKDMVWELFVNDLLGPLTFGAKATGDVYQFVNTGLTRGLARLNQNIGVPLGPDLTKIAPGEARAFYGAGLKEALPATGRTIIRTLPEAVIDGLAKAQLIPEATIGAFRAMREAPLEIGREPIRPAISTDSYIRDAMTGQMKAVPGPLAGVPIVDPLINATGALIRSPTTSIRMLTDVAKSMSARGEIAAQAKRIAYNEELSGAEFATREAQIRRDWIQYPDVVAAAEQRAATNTFTQELGPAGQAFSAALNMGHLRSQVPFFNIPWNLEKTALHEVFPFNIPSMLFGDLKAQLQAGGPARMEAMATIEKGAVLGATFAYLTTNGFLTGPGPSDPVLRKEREKAGKPPNSLLLPGMDPISLARVKPLGMEMSLIAGLAERGVFKEGAPESLGPVFDMLGMTAQATEAWAQIPWSDDALQYASQVGLLHAMVWGRLITEASYYKGVRDIMEAVRDPEKNLTKEAKDLAGGMFAPATIRNINQVYFDRTIRETRDYQDKWLATIPGYSQDLAPHRDRVTGEPMEYPAGWGPDLLSPFKMIEGSRASHVYQVLIDNQIKLRDIPWTIDATAPDQRLLPVRGSTTAEVMNAMPLTGQQRDQWVLGMTQRRDLNVPGYGGLTLREALERLMDNPKFQAASPMFKGDLVHELDGTYREQARKRVLEENPSLKAAVQARKMEQLKRKYLPTTDPRSPLFTTPGGLAIPGAR